MVCAPVKASCVGAAACGVVSTTPRTETDGSDFSVAVVGALVVDSCVVDDPYVVDEASVVDALYVVDEASVVEETVVWGIVVDGTVVAGG